MNTINKARRFVQVSLIGIGSISAFCYVRRRLEAVLAAQSTDVDDISQKSVRATDSMSLKTVQVFFRHGARTPLKHIPGLQEVVYDRKFLIASVPYTEVPVEVQALHGGPRPSSKLQVFYESVKFKGGVIAGMLTTVGKDQMYLLGKRLSARYGNFVGKKFNPEIVHVRSTNIDRCIESLQCVLAGMYGHLSFQDPVVIQVAELSNEILIPSSHHCPSFQELVKQSQLMLERNSEYVSLVNTIQSYTGVKCDISEVDMMQMRDHIVARRAHGLLVPNFLEELYPEIERTAVTVLTSTVCGNIKANPTLGLSFAIGRLLNMIMENLKSSSSCQTESKKCVPKLSLYSCHDSSVAPLLLVLGCFDNKWPPYAADVAVELYEDKNKQAWVKVRYCNKDMILRGCKTPLITLEQFLEIIQPYALTVEQYNDHCNDVLKAVNHVKTLFKNQTSTADDYVSPPNI